MTAMTDERSADNGPQARRRGLRRMVHENWYRDVWLFAITAMLVAMFLVGYQAVQDSRRDAIVRTCRESNERHDKTVATLDRFPLSKRGERVTRALIEQLSPKVEDCEMRARQLVPPTWLG